MESGIYRMPCREFIRMLFRLYARVWLWVSLIVVLCSIIPSILFDLRWIIVTLMLVFIVTPMIATFLYINFGFRKGCVINFMPHRLSVGDKIEVTVFRKIVEDDIDHERNPDDEKENNGRSGVRLETAFLFDIRYKDVYRIVYGVNTLTLVFKDGFLWIPGEGAFSSKERLKEVIPYITGKIYNKE